MNTEADTEISHSSLRASRPVQSGTESPSYRHTVANDVRSRTSSFSSKHSDDPAAFSKEINSLRNTAGHPSEVRSHVKRSTRGSEVTGPVNYHGITLTMAAAQGSLPVFVLVWGMVKAKKLNFFTPNVEGNNVLHYAAMAESSEVTRRDDCLLEFIAS